GMKFGIWFEPEAVSEESELYREHPEWAIQIPGRMPVRSRYQLILDMSNPAVVEYLYHVMSRILKENHIEYVKWDLNRSICDWYTDCLPQGRQMEMSHRYILGLYELLERLTQDFPEVLFEGCSGGGGRFDAGMLYYCPQIWCSDNTDAHDRVFIQYGTSFFYPTSTVGSHVSAVPNHQTGRYTTLHTRGIAAMAGSFGYELDLGRLSDEEKREVAEQVRSYRESQQLIYEVTYYRLSNPFEEGMAAWSWVSEDKAQVLMQGVVLRAASNILRRRLRLVGLDKCAEYRAVESSESYTGAALMAGGILLPKTIGDDAAFEIHLELLR
ncbi:MAG: alpha-galactosidase, partial [Acetatifactor sp.]|nr:alpha-galactosidase [Acetatifactor sp.]